MAAGFFDEQFRLEPLSKMGDPLEILNKHIDFEFFRTTLESSFTVVDHRKGAGHLLIV